MPTALELGEKLTFKKKKKRNSFDSSHPNVVGEETSVSVS